MGRGKFSGSVRGFVALWCCTAAFVIMPVQRAVAGGGPESVAVIIDPTDPDSLYLGNYYVHARAIPGTNVIYLDLQAANYADFVNHQLEAVLGELANRGIAEQIDYVVFASSRCYRIPACGFVSDFVLGDGGVTAFSLSSVFTLGRMANAILAGQTGQGYGLSAYDPSGYFGADETVAAFNGTVGWVGGLPTENVSAPRYLIGAMLGYTGPRGNSPAEIVEMIDRSVASDGTMPDGTFFFMKTTDYARSGQREDEFPAVVSAINNLGGGAVQQNYYIPFGPLRHECLGILTGWPDPEVRDADLTILPGAFCDHLTSWAADFGQQQQTKVSEWIAKGASGSVGAVEEPGLHPSKPGKFPHPRMHLYYYQGLSLGEAAFRSLAYVPFQTVLYGDPLTQPFASIPVLQVMDWAGAGVLMLHPRMAAESQEVEIDHCEVFLDGRAVGVVDLRGVYYLNTAALDDGAHEVRVVAHVDSPVATQCRWVERYTIDNLGRSVDINLNQSKGDFATEFECAVSASGGDVAEIRLLQNRRVVAATEAASDVLRVTGAVLGAGPVVLVAEATYTDGSRARSEPSALEVEFGGACCQADETCIHGLEDECGSLGGEYMGDGTTCVHVSCEDDGLTVYEASGGVGFESPSPVELPSRTAPAIANQPPVAYAYTRDVCTCEPTTVELPAFDPEDGDLIYTVLTPPSQGTLEGSGSVRVLRPFPSAAGTDTLVFQVSDGELVSSPATVTLQMPPEPPNTFTVMVAALGEFDVPVACDPPDTGGDSEHTAPFLTTYPNSGGSVTLEVPGMIGVSPFIHWVVDGEVLTDEPQVTIPLSHNLTALATYLEASTLEVRANRPGVEIEATRLDIHNQNRGTTPFDLIYPVTGPGIQLQAPDSVDGRPFLHWELDGVIETSDTDLILHMDEPRSVVAIYAADTGDFDGDGKVNLRDLGAMQRCFSGPADDPNFVPPSAACLAAFDVGPEADGAIDLGDYVEVAEAVTTVAPGDYDDDQDVDLADFAWLQRCFSGDYAEPGFLQPSTDCLKAFDLEYPKDDDVDLGDFALLWTLSRGNQPGDYDADGDVDLADFAAFQRCYSRDIDELGFVAPSAQCLSAFDLDKAADRDVDQADYHNLCPLLTGAR